MKLYIVYTKDRQVKVQNVTYVTIFDNTLYYLVGDDPSAYLVDLKDVATFWMIE